MQNFIVLGLIPGTNIHTNFTFWLSLLAGIIGVRLTLHVARKRYALRAYLAARKINRYITQYQFQVPA